MNNATNILIIDDDRITRVTIRKMLEVGPEEYNIFEADNQIIAFKILKEKIIDCIVMDYLLTDINGLDLLEKIKEAKFNCPVIMMTSKGNELLAVQAMKSGAYDYLPKSILANQNFSDILKKSITNAINLYSIKKESDRAKIALVMSEERYRSLVENSPILILRIFTDDLTVSFVNDGYCNYFNYNRFEILGENIFNIISEENREIIKEKISQISYKKQIETFELSKKTNNKTYWQTWIMQGIFHDDKRILEYQCMGEDITRLKSIEKELYDQKIFLQSIMDSQDNMIIVMDRRHLILANSSFLSFFGFSSVEKFKNRYICFTDLAIGIDNYIVKPERETWSDLYSDSENSHKLIAFQPEGYPSPKIFSVTASKLIIDVVRYVVEFTDVTELERKSKDFEEKASFDPLTKIYNRRKFNELMNTAVYSNDNRGIDHSIIFFDIDHFKRVNDKHGHDVGDLVLMEIASLVSNSLRKSDLFARWGGEEFVILLPEVNLDKAIEIAEKLRKTIQNHDFSQVKKITCSLGVAFFTPEATSEKVLKKADIALYKAKKSGRNCVAAVKVN